MVQGSNGSRRVRFEGEVPAGWISSGPDNGESLLVGPAGRDGQAPRLRATVTNASDAIQDASLTLMQSIRRQRADAVVASCDIWPHPQWGVGRYIQTAHVHDSVTMAHDVYLFVDEGQQIRIDVECVLGDLLDIEEQVARIVAHTRVEAGDEA